VTKWLNDFSEIQKDIIQEEWEQEEGLSFTSDDESETFAKIDNKGVHAKAYYDMDGNPINANGVSVPAYYNEYLPQKEETIDNEIINGGYNIDSFIFFTDTHWKNNAGISPRLIKHIMENTDCKKAVFGGDATGGTLAEDSYTGMKEALTHKKNMADLENYGRVYQVRGNHDFWGFDSSFIDNNGLNNTQVSNVIMYPQIRDIVRNLEDNPSKGNYYYVDNKASKLRYIFVDEFDGVYAAPSGHWENSVLYVMTSKQINWLVNQAILTTPSGYNIIVIGHCGVLPYVSEAAGYYQKLKNILAAAIVKKDVNKRM
jgi:hypothetical protein